MNRIQPVFLVIVIALWLPIAAVVTSLFGCQAGTTGLFRPMDAQVYGSITNAVTGAATVATGAIPAPFSSAIEAAAAAVLALLAAWQGITHSKLNKLANGQAQQKKEPTP